MNEGLSKEGPHEYSVSFFEGQMAGARSSAAAIVPIVMKLMSPHSVVDVGCGVGVWLASFVEAGVSDVLGLDGNYVDRGELMIPNQQFIAADLAQHFSLDRRFDLVVSLEVGEHLPQSSAPSFVADLVSLGPAVLFSAAIPGQGGEHHVNERWPDYWLSLFEGHGYEAFDSIRPSVWSDPGVEFWYAQNTLLLLGPEIDDAVRAVARSLATEHPPLALVHPRLLELSATRSYSVSQLSAMLAHSVRDAASRRLAIARHWLRRRN